MAPFQADFFIFFKAGIDYYLGNCGETRLTPQKRTEIKQSQLKYVPLIFVTFSFFLTLWPMQIQTKGREGHETTVFTETGH